MIIESTIDVGAIRKTGQSNCIYVLPSDIVQDKLDWLGLSARDDAMGALSATNWRWLILTPGDYGSVTLTLDTDYVGVVELVPDSVSGLTVDSSALEGSVTSGIQSGWIDHTDTTSVANLTQGVSIYDIWVSTSKNAQIGRAGTITGAKIYCGINTHRLIGYGFGVLRATGEANEYYVIGKSEELLIATDPLSAGDNTITFSSPIVGVRPSDIFVLWSKLNAAFPLVAAMTDSSYLPIDDDGTAKVHWLVSNATYTTVDVGDTMETTLGGAGFGVIPIIPLMDSPKVIGVGDSNAQGAGSDSTWRAAGDTDYDNGFMQVAYRQLGWSYENAANIETSSNMSNVNLLDLTVRANENLSVWDKAPEYLHVHCGINDIGEARTWAQYLVDLNLIYGKCQTNSAKLILTALLPWTGNLTNSTQALAEARETFNTNLAVWAKGKEDVYFVNLNAVLETEREDIAVGDTAWPPSGNVYNLITDYTYSADGHGVHLNNAGSLAAGTELARQLKLLVNGAGVVGRLYGPHSYMDTK